MNFILGEFRRRSIRRLISGVLFFAGDILRAGIMRKTFGDPCIALFEFDGLLPEIGPVALHRAFFSSRA